MLVAPFHTQDGIKGKKKGWWWGGKPDNIFFLLPGHHEVKFSIPLYSPHHDGLKLLKL
jgi:hypothetical protein